MLGKRLIAALAVGCLCGSPIIGMAQDGMTQARKAAKKPVTPTYPIAAVDVCTTLDTSIVADTTYRGSLLPCQVAEYQDPPNSYCQWWYNSGGDPFIAPDMTVDTGWPTTVNSWLYKPSVRDPSAKRLLSFFTMSDVHITDKESPAQVPFYGYEFGPISSSSGYSAVILYTTHVLDAAIQTINASHKRDPFDFGIALGDAANNTQYNELRWYLDVIDGKKITPSSGAHKGAKAIDYQKPYQAAGLDKSINWYQAIGNHDQFWVGSAFPNDYICKTLVGSKVLNLGMVPPNQPGALSARGFYMGVVDGSTKYGDIIDAGSQEYYAKPPKVAPDSKRRSLTCIEWMGEFLKTTSNPPGHGFTQEMIDNGFACYSFHPKADIPIKVIVLDDTDKSGSAGAALDYLRYNWLVDELDAGEAAGELMIVCAHVPVRPYVNVPGTPYSGNSALMTTFSSASFISEQTLLNKLWSYQNLMLWIAGHVHRNAITPQPPQTGPNVGDFTYGFWEVETPSLRDLPQQLRRFEIVRNSDNTVSIFVLDVDTAANPDPLPDGSPAWISRLYAVATMQLFGNQVQQGPGVDPSTGVYNAQLVKQLSPAMQAKLSQISP